MPLRNLRNGIFVAVIGVIHGLVLPLAKLNRDVFRPVLPSLGIMHDTFFD